MIKNIKLFAEVFCNRKLNLYFLKLYAYVLETVYINK